MIIRRVSLLLAVGMATIKLNGAFAQDVSEDVIKTILELESSPKYELIFADEGTSLMLGQGFLPSRPDIDHLGSLIDLDFAKVVDTQSGIVRNLATIAHQTGSDSPASEIAGEAIDLDAPNTIIEFRELSEDKSSMEQQGIDVGLRASTMVFTLNFDLATRDLSEETERRILFEADVQAHYSWEKLVDPELSIKNKLVQLAKKDPGNFVKQYGTHMITHRAKSVRALVTYEWRFQSLRAKNHFLSKVNAKYGDIGTQAAIEKILNDSEFTTNVNINVETIGGPGLAVWKDVAKSGLTKESVTTAISMWMETSGSAFGKANVYQATPLTAFGIDLKLPNYGSAAEDIFFGLRYCAASEKRLQPYFEKASSVENYRYLWDERQRLEEMKETIDDYRTRLESAASTLKAKGSVTKGDIPNRPIVLLPEPFVGVLDMRVNESTQVVSKFRFFDEFLGFDSGVNGIGGYGCIGTITRNPDFSPEQHFATTEKDGSIAFYFSGGNATVEKYGNGTNSITLILGRGNSPEEVRKNRVFECELKQGVIKVIYPYEATY